MRQPEAAQHVADDFAQLPIRLRARGARSELGLDRRPVHAVHRGIEVRVANDGPGSVERLAGPRRLRGGNGGHRADDGERAEPGPPIHLMSALICAGTEKTAGSTLPYSTDEIDMTSCVLITLTFVVAGCSRLPNLR